MAVHLPRRFARFLRCERGVVLPLVAVLIVVLIVLAGAAIDFARAINTRQAINHAIDNAALAVAYKASTTLMTQAQAEKHFEDYFNANIKGLYSDVTLGDRNIELINTEGRVVASASAEVPTFFIHHLDLMGADTDDLRKLAVSASSEASFPTRDAEVALVLDVTGSMGGNRITSLKKAAKGLVDTLLDDTVLPGNSRVRISVVPYSEGVNAQLPIKYQAKDTTVSAVVSDGQTTKCVTERMGADSDTDAPFSQKRSGKINYFGGGSSTCSKKPLMPLSAKKAEIEGAIEDMATGGGTAGHTGVAWGYYTLSPKWSELWTLVDKDSAPGEYFDDDRLKFLVLMTDGDFNRVFRPKGTRYNRSGRCKTSSGWVRVSRSGCGISPTTESGNSAKDICSSMKEQKNGLEKIRVYTIYFGNSETSAAAKIMKDCATDEKETYYSAKDQDDLIAAFAAIANDIQNIYLSR
ncbi:pilus assembly protein TadG-related protein [Pseudovibrio exalbescens]|uniref:pilus assembly protein TadG-related protein n=1 Tax=Pseudovibrio exalbescens TaxID=197461 RepID=UPI0023659FE6|nr:VWA domain-containing protein [Pseudovibrio exalbescens]MDD7909502.1 pilus assembly protein TadG-related protein [Pseudovibrio exalbescens]